MTFKAIIDSQKISKTQMKTDKNVSLASVPPNGGHPEVRKPNAMRPHNKVWIENGLQINILSNVKGRLNERLLYLKAINCLPLILKRRLNAWLHEEE